MYIASQWNNTYNVGYVARRKHLMFFCTTQLLCVITFSGMSVTKKKAKSSVPLPLAISGP